MTELIPMIWLGVGLALLVLEVVGVSGLGLFFAGLGAICVGLLTKTGVTPDSAYISQIAWFFSFTVLWTIVLWKPLKKWQDGKGDAKAARGQKVTLEGDTAVVCENGVTREAGEVFWSGTVMRAKISQEEPRERFDKGETVIIVSTSGNTLLIKGM